MATWRAYEALKKQIVTPAYYCNGLFWYALGYDDGNSAKARKARRKGRSNKEAHEQAPAATDIVKIDDVSKPGSGTLLALDESEATPRIEDGQVANDLTTQDEEVTIHITPATPVATLKLDLVESAIFVQEEESVNLPSLPIEDEEPDVAVDTTDLEPDSEDDEPLHTPRPLSSLFSIFSHRASARLSSFEHLPDDVSLLPSSILSSATPLEGEPSDESIEVIKAVLEEEVKLVEKVIEEAIDSKGVDSSLEVQEGESYFDGMKRNFKDVRITKDGIDTEEFLEAVESTLKMFEQFAPSAFPLVQADAVSDIQRLRARCIAVPDKSETLESVVRNESGERRKIATEALKWIVRALKFVLIALQHSLDSPTEELSESFTRSWDAEYSLYFSWIVRPLFKLLIKSCPSRVAFYEKLGAPRERVVRDMREWLVALEVIVKRAEALYEPVHS